MADLFYIDPQMNPYDETPKEEDNLQLPPMAPYEDAVMQPDSPLLYNLDTPYLAPQEPLTMAPMIPDQQMFSVPEYINTPAPSFPGQTPGDVFVQDTTAKAQDFVSNEQAKADTALATVGAVEEGLSNLYSQLSGKYQELAGAQTPEDQQRIQGEIQGLQNQMQSGAKLLGQAKNEARYSAVGAQAAGQAAAQEISTINYENAVNKIQSNLEQRNLQLEEQKRLRDTARSDAKRSRDKYVELLKSQVNDDPATTTSSVLAMIGEFGLAYARNREPDTAGAIKGILEMGRQKLQRQREAAGAEVQAKESDIQDLSTSIAEIQAEGAAQDAAILGQARAVAELQMMKAQGTPREMAAFLAVEELKRAESSAQAKAEMDAEKHLIEMENKRLEGEKTQAEIGKIQGDTKGRGTGSGAGKKPSVYIDDPALSNLDSKTRSKVEQQGVRDPFSGQWIRTTDGGFLVAKSDKIATDLSIQGGAVRDMATISADLAKLMEDNGYEISKWSSEAQQQMNSLFADALLIAKNNDQTGALDEGSVKILTEKLTGGVKPGDWGSTASIIIDASDRSTSRFQKKLRDLSISGTPEGLDVADFDPKKSKGRIEAAARAAGSSKGGDHTGKASAGDPLGEADSNDKYADSQRGAVQRSKAALEKAKRGGVFMPRGPYDATSKEKNNKLEELVKKIEGGDRSPATRDAFAELALDAGIMAKGDIFVFPEQVEGTLRMADQTAQRADAIRVANWMIQNNADPKKIDLDYLRKIKVIKNPVSDKSALIGEIANQYKIYGQGGK